MRPLEVLDAGPFAIKVFERLLTEQANICLEAAGRCENQKAAALLRLLAVDLLLEADAHRVHREAKLDRRLGTAADVK